MESLDAAALIRPAIPCTSRVWADLGAGTGTFTWALAHLLTEARIYAVDRNASALGKLGRWLQRDGVTVVPVTADFTGPLDLPELGTDPLDGLLFANSLHFVADPVPVLRSLVARLRPSGRVVIVEYDRRRANRWVPYPIPAMRVAQLALAAGLTAPTIVATRPSAFGGTLYVAAADRAPQAPSCRPSPSTAF
jgi:SAM-dependent methyltransferase